MSSDRASSPAEFESRIRDVAEVSADRYEVDGQVPARAVAPRNVDEVRECLAAADAADMVVVPWGGGTQMGVGNLPEAVDLAIDLRGLDGVVAYEPDDLTVAVQAGCTLARLNATLGEHGQMLPVDAAHADRATIGGLVAAGLSGPRRFGYGALRDLIIGVTAVLPDGRLSRGGGMVVKNVSGFDMMRLYHGSLGALAVIVQVNFKILPRPRAQRTVVARYSTLAPAVSAAEAVRLSQLGPSAIVLLDDGAASRAGVGGAPWTLLLRCEAPPVAVVRQAERISDAVSDGAESIETLDESRTDDVWLRVSAALSAAPVSGEIGVRIGARPSALASLVEPVNTTVDENGLERATALDLGSGIAYVRLASTGSDNDGLRRAWDALSQLGDHAALLTAPPEVKQGTDVFGRLPAGFDVMRSMKEQFDPRRTLNRGRFAGRL